MSNARDSDSKGVAVGCPLNVIKLVEKSRVTLTRFSYVLIKIQFSSVGTIPFRKII